jgi:SAM-dependent methyltransferase
MSDESQKLLAEAHALCADDYFRDVIWRHCRHLDDKLSLASLDTRIHLDDQMLLHSLHHHRDANASFSQYYNVALQQYHAVQQILRALFGDAIDGQIDQVKILDFACGYGRLLRFLSLSLPVNNIWASEIQTDALAFVCDSYKVQGIPSYGNPENFQPGRQFQFIWVASLFSHLPGDLFQVWVKRLSECLTPDGVLCFSVHDECLLPTEHNMPEDGILFFPVSENADLDKSIYGTTYVTEHYVAQAITQTCGADCNFFRIPRGLAHEQDIYVVSAAAGRDLSALQTFRRGPWGWVDERTLSETGELYLRGWAASIDDGPLATIDITVDGKLHKCPTGKYREDVGRVFEDPRLNHAGWEFRHILARGTDPIRIEVTAKTPQQEMALLYTGQMTRPESLQLAKGSLWRRLVGAFAKK